VSRAASASRVQLVLGYLHSRCPPIVPRDSTSVTTAPVSARTPAAMNAELKLRLASTRHPVTIGASNPKT
jgi:hypothetical protein